MTTDCPAADGYQIQTRSSRFVPGTGASGSNATESVQSWIARPTAKEPVGVGSVTSDRFSSQRNPSNATILRTPSTANTAKLLSTPRSNRVIVIRGPEAQASEDPSCRTQRSRCHVRRCGTFPDQIPLPMVHPPYAPTVALRRPMILLPTHGTCLWHQTRTLRNHRSLGRGWNG